MVLAGYVAYREDIVTLAVGDIVQTSMRGKSKDGRHVINAGQRYTIADFTEAGDPVLNNGWVLDKYWGGLMQGYVRTSQGVQGKTALHGIVVYRTSSLVATRQEGFLRPRLPRAEGSRRADGQQPRASRRHPKAGSEGERHRTAGTEAPSPSAGESRVAGAQAPRDA